MSENKTKQNILDTLALEPNNLVQRLLILFIVLALVIWGNSGSNFSLTEKGLNIAKAIFGGITHPETLLLFNWTVKGKQYLLLS